MFAPNIKKNNNNSKKYNKFIVFLNDGNNDVNMYNNFVTRLQSYYSWGKVSAYVWYVTTDTNITADGLLSAILQNDNDFISVFDITNSTHSYINIDKCKFSKDWIKQWFI